MSASGLPPRVVRAAIVAVPSPQLAGDIALLLPRSPSPTASGSTEWICAQRVDQGDAGSPPGQQVEVGFGVAFVARYHSVYEAHHVERRAVDRLVRAESESRWRRHPGRAHRRDDPVLARHVVGGRQEVAGGRSAQHVAGARRVGHLERQVAPSARDQDEVQGEASPPARARRTRR